MAIMLTQACFVESGREATFESCAQAVDNALTGVKQGDFNGLQALLQTTTVLAQSEMDWVFSTPKTKIPRRLFRVLQSRSFSNQNS